MRLRTRLSLAFAALSLVPMVAVLPFAQANLRDSLSRDAEERMNSALSAAHIALLRRAEEITRTVVEVSQSLALEDVAPKLHAGSLRREDAEETAERLMRSPGLTVLSLLDGKGTTLLSGHLRGRIGDPDPALFATAGKKDAVTTLVELSSDAGLKQSPALVAARSMDYGDLKIWVVGGMLFDASFAEYLKGLTGARIEITSTHGLVAASGTAEPPLLMRELNAANDPLLAAGVSIKLFTSAAPLLKAESGLARYFILLAAVGLSSSVLVGLLLSRIITRPVEALTEGARRIARGELNAHVETRASGEVAELVNAFNRMTSDLSRTTEQLVASERVAAWQEVARRLAHEIKNPLTPIKMSLETLQAASEAKSPRFAELFKESAVVVLEEVERLRRIIDEFSRFARLPKPSLAPVDLSDLTRQLLSLYSSPPPGIEIHAENESRLMILGDRDQLTQVLVNVLKNAEEAVAGGGSIWVRTSPRGASAVVEIEDTGPGIRAEDRIRIFEPYFTTKTGGTGLGLAIAARVCQEHGGTLEVDPRPGRGAIFRLSIPRLLDLVG